MITFNEARSKYYQMGWSAEQAAKACGMDEATFLVSLAIYKMQARKQITEVFYRDVLVVLAAI